MAETKAAFRRRLGRLLRILNTGTTTSDGTTLSFVALTLTDFFPSDDNLKGAFVYDVTGAEWRVVREWVGDTGTAVVNRAYTAPQLTGRALEVYSQFSPQELDESLQQALVEAYPYITTRVMDTSLTVIANQYNYAVPSTIRDLERMRGGRVQWQQNTAIATFPYADFEHWEVLESGSTKTLVIPGISGKTNRTIRLIGWGIQSYPATDAVSIDLEDDSLQLLAYKAAEIIWRAGPNLSGKDAQFAAGMSGIYRALFDANKDSWGVKMVPTRMEGPDGYPFIDAPMAYNHAEPS